MQLDVSTIEVVTTLVFAMTASFLSWTWYTQRSSSALMWWALTFAVAAVSSAVTWQDGGAFDPVSLVADDYLLILAHLFLWCGFRAFNAAGPPFGWAGLSIAIFTLSLLVLQLPLRAFLDVAVLIGVAITVAATVEFRRETEQTLSWRRVVIGIMTFHAAFMVARLFLAGHDDMPPAASFEDWRLVVFLIEPMLLAVALGFTMIGMVSERLGASLEVAAQRDPLTGALNRRGLEDWLGRRRVRATALADTGLAAIFADLDHFKAVNDTHGHAVGDEVLTAFARLVSEHLRLEDVLVRFGGEEFVILLPGADTAAAALVAERIRAALAGVHLPTSAGPLSATASFGVAAIASSRRPTAFPQLLDAADAALYVAKRGGRNRVEIAPEVARDPTLIGASAGKFGDAAVGR